MDIVIVEGKISKIEPSNSHLAEAEGEIIHADNTIALPGFINGHHHSHENFHKGRYDRLPLELWVDYVRPTTPLQLTPDDVYVRTLIGASQALFFFQAEDGIRV